MSKHLQYLGYIVRHKWFVFLAGAISVGHIPLWRLLIHDWSKFLPCEWLPYTRFFYGDYPKWDDAKIQCPGYSSPTKESVASSFNRAWLPLARDGRRLDGRRPSDNWKMGCEKLVR